MRPRGALVLALLGGLALAGCAGGSRAHRADDSRDAGPIEMAITGVSSLNPARALTAEDTEIDWSVYTPLLTYRHARGQAGTELVPGVAQALPTITDGGRLYTLTVRRGLRFSDGRVLRASDVVATFERALRTPDSPVAPMLTPVLVGADAFVDGRTPVMTGLQANDASGEVTIRLSRPDPGFEAVLAEPALGIIPSGTPLRSRPGHPPPGIGPYRLRAVVPGRSFTLQRNPYWVPEPGIPAGALDIQVTLSADPDTDALAVLNDVLDVEDPAQPLGPGTLGELARLADGREQVVADGRPDADLFLDAHAPPFDDRLAREAVTEALGTLTTLGRAASPNAAAGCDIAPLLAGVATPDGCPAPVISAAGFGPARSLVLRSGTAGDAVTVWSPRSGPQRAWLRAEAAVLDAIGYVARVQTLAAASYRSEIVALVPRPPSATARRGSSTVRPLLDRRAVKGAPPALIRADAVVDGRLRSELRVTLDDALTVAVGPAVSLGRARSAHQVTFAQTAVPELVSSRMSETATVIDPLEGLDLTSLRLR